MVFQTSKFHDFLSYLKEKSVLITTHKLADIDAFASCVVLQHFLSQFLNSKNIFLFIPEISKITTEFFERITKKYSNITFNLARELVLPPVDVILVVDTNNLAQVNFEEQIAQANFIFIDHHFFIQKNYSKNIYSLNLISDEYSSTAEIVFELCESNSFNLALLYRYLLIAAILSDSGSFNYANNKTIKNVSLLLKDDLNFQEILTDLKFDKEIDEKIAKIKGLQRVKLIREKEWLIGVSHVGGYEAEVAKVLTQVGFDLSIVKSEKKEEIRITTRAKKSICLRTGLHLGKLLEQISKELNCSGGGHEGAASLNCQKTTKDIVEKIIVEVKQILNK